MKLQKKLGSTSEIWQIFIRDSSSTTGAGLAGLTSGTGGLIAYYHRDTDTTATAISLTSMTSGTFTSSGFKEIDATHMPGWYQFCPPNAALASGAKSVGIHLQGAANMAPLPIEVQLTGFDIDDAVRGGMTAMPNANAEAAGGLYTRGTGAGQIKQSNNGRIDSDVQTIVNGAIAAATFAANALDAVWSTAVRLLTAGTNIVLAKGTGVTGFNDLDAAGVRTAVGLASANLDTQLGAIKTDVDAIPTTSYSSDISAIKSKTDNLPSDPADESLIIDATNAIVTILGSPAGASLAADVAAVKSDTGAIKAKTDNLPASPASSGDVSSAQSAIIAAMPAPLSTYKKNIAVTGYMFRLYDTSGAPATGLSPVVKVGKDGGALATSSNSASELTLGWYTIDLTSGEMNAKTVALNFAVSGAVSYGVVLQTDT